MKLRRLILLLIVIFTALYWAFLIPYTVMYLRYMDYSDSGKLSIITGCVCTSYYYDWTSERRSLSESSACFRYQMMNYYYCQAGYSYMPRSFAVTDGDGNIVARSGSLLWVIDERTEGFDQDGYDVNRVNDEKTVYSGYLEEVVGEKQMKKFYRVIKRHFISRYNNESHYLPVRSVSFHSENGVLTPVALTFQYYNDGSKPLTLTLSDLSADVIYNDEDPGYAIDFLLWVPVGSVFTRIDSYLESMAKVEKIAEDVRSGAALPDAGEIGNGLVMHRETVTRELYSEEGSMYFIAAAEWNNFVSLLVYSRPYFVLAVTVGFAAVFLFVLVSALLLRRRAARTRAQRRALLAAAAHELKTPLAVMQNQCECVLENVAPQKNGEYLASIAEETARVEALAERFRTFAELSDADKPNRSAVFLHTLIERETEKYRPLALQHGATVETRIEPVVAYCDGELLALAVDNLLSNAIRYATGEKSVRLELKPLKKGFVFRASNPAERLSAAERRRLWDPLYRRNKARTGGGSGLGLPICARVFWLHRFRYGCDCRNGRVIFWFGTAREVRK